MPDDEIVYLFQFFSAACRAETPPELAAQIRERIEQASQVIVVNPKLPVKDHINLLEE